MPSSCVSHWRSKQDVRAVHDESIESHPEQVANYEGNEEMLVDSDSRAFEASRKGKV